MNTLVQTILLNYIYPQPLQGCIKEHSSNLETENNLMTLEAVTSGILCLDRVTVHVIVQMHTCAK